MIVPLYSGRFAAELVFLFTLLFPFRILTKNPQLRLKNLLRRASRTPNRRLSKAIRKHKAWSFIIVPAVLE